MSISAANVRKMLNGILSSNKSKSEYYVYKHEMLLPVQYAIKFVPNMICKFLDVYYDNLLHFAAQYNYDSLKFLLKKRLNMNNLDHLGFTPLHYAAMNDLNTVTLLMKYGANVNALNSSNQTPIFLAIEHDKINIVKYFLKNGAKINVYDRYKNTPLHLACEQSDELIELLLENNANVNAKNIDHITPIYNAIESKKNVKLLLKNKAELNIQEKLNNYTPLHLATSTSKQYTRILLEYGASPNIKNLQGLYPINLLNSNKENEKYAFLFYLYGSFEEPMFRKKNIMAKIYQTYKILSDKLYFGPARGVMEYLYDLPKNYFIYRKWDSDIHRK